VNFAGNVFSSSASSVNSDGAGVKSTTAPVLVIETPSVVSVLSNNPVSAPGTNTDSVPVVAEVDATSIYVPIAESSPTTAPALVIETPSVAPILSNNPVSAPGTNTDSVPVVAEVDATSIYVPIAESSPTTAPALVSAPARASFEPIAAQESRVPLRYSVSTERIAPCVLDLLAQPARFTKVLESAVV
jgi:hypothetical protein